MIFGEVPVVDALDAVLAHSVSHSGGRFPKGHVLSSGDLEILAQSGVQQVVIARLEPGDIGEDEAAELIASAIPGAYLRRSPAATGRVNLYATESGLFCANRSVVDTLNRIDPAITLACLADRAPVQAGDMVATVKIIPLAVAGDKVEQARSALALEAPFVIKPFRSHNVTLIATELPSLKPSTMDKTRKILEQRLSLSASPLANEVRVAHAPQAVASAISETMAAASDRPKLIVVFGASAVVDAADVIPAAIELAGGEVEQVGLPVDPGNLLVLGRIGAVPVVGAPGCARSPKENGFDWVLNRLLAGEYPDRFELTGLGVGGLLMEIPTRPRPREEGQAERQALKVGALLMAAGQARRMGHAGHKLLAEFSGKPLVRDRAEMLLKSQARPVLAVTGHRRVQIDEALADLDIVREFNPLFTEGMGSSLASGFASEVLRDLDGVLVMLADMPAVTAEHIDALLRAFQENGGGVIVRACGHGKRGNPIILPKALFDKVRRLEGDVGARALIEGSGLAIIEVEIGDAAHIDVDTPDAVVAAGGRLQE
ncbi:molybdopterin-binding/glycosyltransferase family 2 protein [Rhizobium oryzicola]|uniref:Molybdopterin-binding/glycosyltransferase family 2 protein n=1 Tax=Rhizobium oryzicola TaxID=1232668 RepID=A0ABT8T939_9HYPH|nr:molybdopterin-binding/glycosyltransferase family 2 protein [Rhizobium oryzicola]MDO1585622.1 molybdopterin-binding/glycosyltransferase family 2 protein [Rhizobium oryzicola]